MTGSGAASAVSSRRSEVRCGGRLLVCARGGSTAVAADAVRMTVEVGRLAAVLAHPDDESRIVGGTLALAAARGYEVSVYCATRGEAGDPERPPHAVAAARGDELAEACALLGVSSVWMDRFPDGGVADADTDRVVGRMAAFLRATRPHTVITFGPDGRTGHPDHVAVGRRARRAFTAAAEDPAGLHVPGRPWRAACLYHTAVAASVARRVGWSNPALPDDELLAVDVAPVLDRKRQAAVEAHASQWALSPFDLTHGWEPWSVEHFVLAATATAAEPRDVLAELAR